MKANNRIFKEFWDDNKFNHLPFLQFINYEIRDLNKAFNLIKSNISKETQIPPKVKNEFLADLDKALKQPKPSLKKSIRKIKKIIQENENLEKEIIELFESPDWRINLTGGIFCLLINKNKKIINKIWQCLDNRCYVSPQLLVVLFNIDTNFYETARLKIQNRAKINQQGDFPLFEEISMKGPASNELESKKYLGALIYLFEKNENGKKIIEDQFDEKELSRIKSMEDYNGYKIASTWEQNLIDNWYLLTGREYTEKNIQVDK